MRSRHGFTLLEVLYVMVVISILCGVAAPYFIDWLATIRMQTVARQLQLDLMWARS